VSRRQGRSFGLTAFKVTYWSALMVLPIALFLVVPERHLKMAFNTLTLIAYGGIVTAFYQLILRFIYLSGGSEDVEKELRDSEGRVELNLRDRR
jgi:hypothetical protein